MLTRFKQITIFHRTNSLAQSVPYEKEKDEPYHSMKQIKLFLKSKLQNILQQEMSSKVLHALNKTRTQFCEQGSSPH